MIQLGRNAPCHCGSGKKYKKCHLEADERNRAAIRAPEPEPELSSKPASPSESESPRPFVDVRNLPKLLRQLSERGSAADRKEFRKLLSETEAVFQYMERQSEIEAAAARLEAHRSAFAKLAADETRYLALAQSLFSEECFAPMRFRASDVQEAFDHVGYPAMMSHDDQTVQTLRAAILHIANKQRRNDLSMRLLMQLPEFVAAGRYLEAWVLQTEALQTTEEADESNPFLFQMFSYGYDAWAANNRAKSASLLHKMGFDLDTLNSMSLDELDSWMQSQAPDSANTRAMEEFLRKNPQVREESIANLQAMERNAPKLLEREGARFLFLPVAEIQPWATCLNEALVEQGFVPETLSAETAEKLFQELLLPLTRDMAAAIFTPERIRQLVEDLKQYRNRLFASGDKTAAGEIMGAITYLEREDTPGENSFLVTLCWTSLAAATEALSSVPVLPG